MYADDSQIVAVQSTKAHDNIGSCNGRVEVQVRSPDNLCRYRSLDEESWLYLFVKLIL
jgi:hypothetical protein